jgi:spiro-SPASM protein
MKNIAIINALGISRYAFEPLADGTTAFVRALRFGSELPEVEKIVILAEKNDLPLPDSAKNTEIVTAGEGTSVELLSLLHRLADGYNHVFYFYGDCPLLDSALTKGMYEKHLRYFAQYTFADGFPYGLTPEILHNEIIEPLEGLAKKQPAPVARDTLFTVLQKDINAFDIETEISRKDMRLLRVVLACDNKRNYTQSSSIIDAGGMDEPSIITILDEKPQLLRTFPSYIGVQIVDGCPQACSYCPYPKVNQDLLTSRTEMSLEQFNHILSQVSGLAGDAVISFSTWGEPGLHSDIVSLIESCLSTAGLSLIIETSGIGWKPDAFDQIKAVCDTCESGNERIDWIVSLDAMDLKLYSALRGQGYTEAVSASEKLISLFPDHTYIQAVRMKENEEDLETFFRHWKEKAGNVIIQKYDHFAGHLDQRKVTDLSPLKRFPCWHVKRDITVLLDGTVPMCREDLEKKTVLGNIFTDSLESIWAAGEEQYSKHIAEEYPSLCTECDEYYTYNF